MPTQSRRSRDQVMLCGVGLVLVMAGVALATVTARSDWTPPLELSVIHEQAGGTVALVAGGSAGPIVDQLEIRAGRTVLWSRPLSHDGAGGRIRLPSALLVPASRVALTAKGRIVREVDG